MGRKSKNPGNTSQFRGAFHQYIFIVYNEVGLPDFIYTFPIPGPWYSNLAARTFEVIIKKLKPWARARLLEDLKLLEDANCLTEPNREILARFDQTQTISEILSYLYPENSACPQWAIFGNTKEGDIRDLTKLLLDPKWDNI